MELREIKLSIKFVSIVRELNAFWIILKGFSWTKEELNALLLKRSAQLFEIELRDNDRGRFTLSNRRKTTFMRTLKNNVPEQKRSFLTSILSVFRRAKNGTGKLKQKRKLGFWKKPIAKNVFHKIE